jgi:hypothetical protein
VQAPVIDEVVEESLEEIPDSELFIYDTEGTNTKISALTGTKADNTSGFSDCDEFRYKDYYYVPYNPYPGNVINITLSKADTILSIEPYSVNKDKVYFDSLTTISPTQIRCILKSIQDTIKVETAHLILKTKSGKLIKKNLKTIGLINTKSYGSCFWAVRHFRKANNTFTTPLSQATDITSSYQPQKGDILFWSTDYLATVGSQPITIQKKATKTKPAYQVTQFVLLEMNAKCKGTKSAKKVNMNPSDIEGTLISANSDRGAPEKYYRNE